MEWKITAQHRLANPRTCPLCGTEITVQDESAIGIAKRRRMAQCSPACLRQHIPYDPDEHGALEH